MKTIRYLRTHKLVAMVVALGAVLLFDWGWSLTASLRGKIAATIDVHRGRYQVLGYGLADRSRSEYARCLRERYHVEYHTVAGCIVSESLVSYAKAYHSVVAETTSRKFGRDVFQQCEQEAEQIVIARELKRRQTSGTIPAR